MRTMNDFSLSGSDVVGRNDLARLYMRRVQPECARTIKVSSLDGDNGDEAIVNGCDWNGEIVGNDRNTCSPGDHVRSGGFGMVTLVTCPGRAVRCALHDSIPWLLL